VVTNRKLSQKGKRVCDIKVGLGRPCSGHERIHAAMKSNEEKLVDAEEKDQHIEIFIQ
jgi:hypothetical protein